MSNRVIPYFIILQKSHKKEINEVKCNIKKEENEVIREVKCELIKEENEVGCGLINQSNLMSSQK